MSQSDTTDYEISASSRVKSDSSNQATCFKCKKTSELIEGDQSSDASRVACYWNRGAAAILILGLVIADYKMETNPLGSARYANLSFISTIALLTLFAAILTLAFGDGHLRRRNASKCSMCEMKSRRFAALLGAPLAATSAVAVYIPYSRLPLMGADYVVGILLAVGVTSGIGYLILFGDRLEKMSTG